MKKVVRYERQKEKGTLPELSEDFIIKTYKLSKRKEHAFVDRLSDENIRIFCGDEDEEILNPSKKKKGEAKEKEKR